MRPLLLLVLMLVSLGSVTNVAFADTSPPSPTTWAQLDPGDDFAAQVVRDLFPTEGASGDTIGTESTVIGRMVGKLSWLVFLLGTVWVSYSLILQIHRASETGQVFGESMGTWAPVRIAFAIIMMVPMASGFDVGQAAVKQVSLWAVGMARTVYVDAIKAIGPDAVPIAQPMIPGTKQIVAGLIQNEMCRAMINAASANPNLVPVPTPVTGGTAGAGGYVTWSYSLSPGNETGTPVCGTVTLRVPAANQQTVAGVAVDMTATQRTILTQVVEQDIRPGVEQVAQALWDTRQANAMKPLMATFVNATNDYTAKLTDAATNVTSQLRGAVQVAAARNGSSTLQASQDQLAALGWSGAGAYYMEIARLNGQTLSLLSATPEVNSPSYAGLGEALSNDLAPLMHGLLSFESKINTYAKTTDGMDVPGGNGDLFTGATPDEDGASTIDRVVRSLHVTERLLSLFSSTSSRWSDPFAALIQLGQNMVLTALLVLGTATALASTTATVAATAGNVLTLNFSGALATVTGHLMMNFLAGPIFSGCMALLVPGLVIAFVLPMIPMIMWVAGVAGWLILVCEAMVAVPLWMFAHLTFQGDGLHGKGFEGYSLLFNILFRPVLMLFGLFLGYFIFSSCSWLIMQLFGVASSYAIANGWLVTNLLGVIVLVCMFVLMHVVIATMSFRLIGIVPHQVVKWVGLQPANRVDMEDFAQRAGMGGTGQSVQKIAAGVQTVLDSARGRGDGGRRNRYIANRLGSAASGQTGADTTLQASTDFARSATGKERK